MYSKNYYVSGKTTSNGVKFQDLRKKYPRFIYENYSWRISGAKPRGGHATLRGKNNLEILFDFRIEPNIHFKPNIIIENIDRNLLKSDFNKLDNLIFHLGLMEIPSYWKATCSPIIEIQAGYLNKEQINWWKDLIMKGMGQFFFENKINFKKPNLFTIGCSTVKIPSNLLKSNLLKSDFNRFKLNGGNGILVPVGGGKDSVVTLEILSAFAKASADKEKIKCFSLNPTDATRGIIKIAGCKKPIIVRRTIDKKLLELNQKGFLNGHTPFSAYLAFLSVLVATIFSQKYIAYRAQPRYGLGEGEDENKVLIAFSNERSSNEGNVKYLDKVINHQWSKSFEFEQKFRKYSQKYLTPHQKNGEGIEYFSFLRPLYEIQIAKLFSKYPKYFNAFLSCNEAYKTASGTKKPTKKWCGKCSKCLFVFTVLYPFVGKKNPPSPKATEDKELIKIFGKNLFGDKKLLPIMQQLVGERGFKPFECVGTKKESLIAFYLSYKKYIGVTYVNLPILLDYFEKKILPKYPNLEKESKKIMDSWNTQNNLPSPIDKLLKKYII